MCVIFIFFSVPFALRKAKTGLSECNWVNIQGVSKQRGSFFKIAVTHLFINENFHFLRF